MTNAPTFSQQLERLAPRNAATLTQRAVIANRVAKTATGASRKLAYQIKAQATTRLISMEWASLVAGDSRGPNIVLVRLHVNGCGLHLRRAELAA